ncbi:MAG: rRNA (cytidine-2'-O-)-methyltransferase, partial [Mesorhizobium sp.]
AERAGPHLLERLGQLAAEMPASKAAAEAAKMTGGQKQALYRRLLGLKDAGGG